MIGLGITMPVLPFYVERLALAEGVSRQLVVIHVGLLTGVYALGQLIFAPVARAEFEKVADLPKTHRGDGGFGSTGRE